jgi:hypothetical protein
MINYITISQIIVTISVLWVWIFRYDNVVAEFIKFNLNGTTRNLVGTTKIVLATLLITGIWFNELTQPAAVGMATMMFMAQYFHFRVNSTLLKRVPSFILLVLSVYITLFT